MAGNPAWSVRALSVPGPDTDLALFVSFDDARFLFGAGEAMQRSLVQKRMSLRKLQAIFMMSGSHGRGGLAGGLMTLSDAGIKRLSVVGPPDIAHHIATLRASVVRDSQTVDLLEYPRDSPAASEVVYTSPRITVHAVALRPETPEPQVPVYPARPSELSPAALDKWTTAIVNDMFRGPGSDQALKDTMMPLFEGIWRPGSADDRYPLPLASEADVATDMVYIVRTPDVRGKFDVKKAVALGVPNGPIRGKLTRGEIIEVDDASAPGGKREVRPEQCLVGGGPGGTLIIATCSQDNLPRLLASTAFDEYRQKDGGEPATQVQCIVHTCPRAVWTDPAYQAWVGSFGPKTEHLYADEKGTNEIFFRSSAWNALQLNLLDPTIFPVPTHAFTPSPPPAMPPNAQPLIPNHIINMYPSKPVALLDDHIKDVAFPTDEGGLAAARTALRASNPDYAAAVDAAQAAIAADAQRRSRSTPLPGDDIVVTTLGTGSAIPSIYRNVSCTHLDIPGTGGVLLDCGEGSLGQLRRRFGSALKHVYADLRLIFVSHMHADHHLGLASILKDRFDNGIHSKLYLVAPNPIAIQLEETAFWQSDVPRAALENVVFIPAYKLKHGWVPGFLDDVAMEEPAPPPPMFRDQAVAEEGMAADVLCGKRKWPFVNPFRGHPSTAARVAANMNDLLADLKLDEIHTPTVAHRGAAWGMVLTGRDGWKVVYSGDTKPCDALVDAGQGATVLIHEATLEDDKPEDAEAKGHSTFGQAIDAGRRMNARYVILNHFSQRYPKIPKLPAPEPVDENGQVVPSTGPTVAISFDYMSLRAADAWKMSHFTEPLSLLYAEEEEEGVDEEAVVEEEKKKAKEGKEGKKGKAEGKQARGEGQEGKRAKGEGRKAKNGEAGKQEGKKAANGEGKKARNSGAAGTKRASDASADEPVAKKAREAVVVEEASV